MLMVPPNTVHFVWQSIELCYDFCRTNENTQKIAAAAMAEGTRLNRKKKNQECKRKTKLEKERKRKRQNKRNWDEATQTTLEG